jgi:hypothetical protein
MKATHVFPSGLLSELAHDRAVSLGENGTGISLVLTVAKPDYVFAERQLLPFTTPTKELNLVCVVRLGSFKQSSPALVSAFGHTPTLLRMP